MKRKILLIYALLVLIPSRAQMGFLMQSPMPKHEVRGVWVTTLGGLDWPATKATTAAGRKKQQEELCTLLDELKASGINTVFLQTRVRGTVIYPSSMEPWDASLTGVTGKDPGYDPLAFAIDQCHQRQMELHAWVVSIPCFKSAPPRSVGKKSLMQSHPKLLCKYDGTYYMNPGMPETARYLSDLCQEIAKQYDIDGIHLDYIRYPDRPEAFSDATLFRKYGKGRKRDQWRRDNITAIVAQVYTSVKKLKPWVRLSCSPVGKYKDVTRFSAKGWSAWSTVYQDAQGWLNQGIMDMLCPMMYFQGDHFYPFAADWQESCNGRTIVPGLGVYFLSPKEKDWDLAVVQRQIHFLRSERLGGQAYFRCRHLTDNTKGLLDYLQGEFYPYPALMPPMTWQDSIPPASPELVCQQRQNGIMEHLRWKAVNKAGTYCRYAIYADTLSPVNLSDPSHLVTVVSDTTYTYNLLSAKLYGLHLAITAIDRFGNESKPLQVKPVLQ